MTENLKAYVGSWKQLNDLIKDGLGESIEAERLRDNMDTIWYRLTLEDIEEFRGLRKCRRVVRSVSKETKEK